MGFERGLMGFERGGELALKGRHSLDIQQHSLTNNNETEGGGVEGDEIVVEEAAEAAVVGKLAWCADIQLVVLFHEP